MPKKPTQAPKLRPDVAETAFRVMQEATGDAPRTKPPSERSKAEKNPEAAARGAKGGKKGGNARAKKLTSDERSNMASIAAQARWKKSRD